MKSLIVKRKVENFQKLNHEHASMEDREIIEDAVTEAIESRQLSIGEHLHNGEHDDFGEDDDDMDGHYGMTQIVNSAAAGYYSTAIRNRAYAGGDIQFAIGASGTAPVEIGESGANNNALVILKNGNVGIDLASPTAKLDISGNIHVNTTNYKKCQIY